MFRKVSIFVFLLGVISCQVSTDDLPDISPDVDWPTFISQHDRIIMDLPGDMTEAPHFGNGLIGSMIWFEDNLIRLQVFRSDVHDHADHTYGWTAYSRPRYQIGYFTLEPRGEIISCELRQDIFNACLIGKIITSSGSLEIKHLVHRQDDVIFTEISTQGAEDALGWIWHPFEAKGSRGGSPDSKGYGQAYAPYQKVVNPGHTVRQHEDIFVGVQDLTAGGDYTTAWNERKPSKNKSRLLITIQNSFPEKSSEDRAYKTIQDIRQDINSDLLAWEEEHKEWWHKYYPESFVRFPDPAGESFYWNNVYRLACCTRPDAKYIDTPGLWNSGGPWPYSTHDFNTQTAHFPVYTSNRLHLGEALINSLNDNANNLIDNVVPEEWRYNSALLPLATAYDLRGKRDGDGRYSEMVGCLPWLLNNVWLHYRYSMDEEILQETVLPLLRRSINFYRHLLFEGEDGKLHLPPTFTPETGLDSDSNFDLALLKWGCKRLLEICEILDIDDPLKDEWRKILDLSVDYSVDEMGYMRGRERSAPLDHQHMSHLMMIYPLYLENIDNCEDAGLLEKSVRNFQPVTMPKMGASQSSPAAAALGLGNLALERMNDILYRDVPNEKLGKNGIYYLSTPCIETSLSYNTCVQDMLLQSWGDKIRVFPALPDTWADLEFHDFRAEGAFLVSAKRVAGRTEWVRIKSLAGEPCLIKPAMEREPKLQGLPRSKIRKVEEGCYLIKMDKGQEVILY